MTYSADARACTSGSKWLRRESRRIGSRLSALVDLADGAARAGNIRLDRILPRCAIQRPTLGPAMVTDSSTLTARVKALRKALSWSGLLRVPLATNRPASALRKACWR